MSLRQPDINWVAVVIRSSGVATKTQREAIIRHIQDRSDANKERTRLERRQAREREQSHNQ